MTALLRDSYLSVQPSFTFILVFLKGNKSIREGLVLFALRGQQCRKQSVLLHGGFASTGSAAEAEEAPPLLLWLSAKHKCP